MKLTAKQVLKEMYHPEDAMMHHILHAYVAQKFNKQDLRKKHLDFAMDHASNNPKNEYTRSDLEDMVDNGAELFHDEGDSEIKDAPTGFVKSPDDREIGQ